MKKLAKLWLMTAIFFASNFLFAQDEILPVEIFILGKIEIGKTKLSDVQKIYGKAQASRIGQENESAIQICYVHHSQEGKSFVIFETGAMGGFKRITSFRLTTINPRKDCSSTNVDLTKVASGNGIKLKQNREQFLKNFHIDFKSSKENLVYEGVGKRQANEEEMKNFQATEPSEKQIFFDVTMSVKAKFVDNKLVDYDVSKIESY